MASIVLATCRTKPGLTPGDTLLATALERAGASVTAAPWDALDPADTDGAIVCLRSTWDYHLRWDEFRRWIAGFTGHGRLWNPAATVLWNADKRYLQDLAEAGIALPRTRWFEPGERPDTEAVLAEWGLERGVLKPRVSATAFGTHLIARGQRLPEAEWRPLENAGCLLQAFVADIATRGEVSLMYLDGVYSHAVLKRPASGDFRVQTDFGGRLERAVPAGERPRVRRRGARRGHAAMAVCESGPGRLRPRSGADGAGADRAGSVSGPRLGGTDGRRDHETS